MLSGFLCSSHSASSWGGSPSRRGQRCVRPPGVPRICKDLMAAAGRARRASEGCRSTDSLHAHGPSLRAGPRAEAQFPASQGKRLLRAHGKAEARAAGPAAAFQVPEPSTGRPCSQDSLSGGVAPTAQARAAGQADTAVLRRPPRASARRPCWPGPAPTGGNRASPFRPPCRSAARPLPARGGRALGNDEWPRRSAGGGRRRVDGGLGPRPGAAGQAAGPGCGLPAPPGRARPAFCLRSAGAPGR